jgi:hypothetical protein
LQNPQPPHHPKFPLLKGENLQARSHLT